MLLKPAYNAARLPGPNSWDDIASGEFIREQTQSLINDYGRRLRGGTTLLMGPLSQQLNCHRFTLQKVLQVSPVVDSVAGGHCQIKAQLEYLPVKNASVEQVIMPFVLEFSRDPHQILREANRVLVDDGYLLLTGFNPLSPALLSGWLPGKKKSLPWAGRYFTALRVRDWLSLLGYELVQYDYFVGRFLFLEATSAAEQQKTAWTEKLCRKLTPLSACYAILARKRVYIELPTAKVKRISALTGQPVAVTRLSSTLKRN
ncbi:class I SAM-dependent methyltransferase [Idiomarina seosinensis]|uniref:class I SAM-dependent methyltransferase n=1 Tax=Idiomarina seosinensis TaxID=281739 RepID=UPI00384E594F